MDAHGERLVGFIPAYVFERNYRNGGRTSGNFSFNFSQCSPGRYCVPLHVFSLMLHFSFKPALVVCSFFNDHAKIHGKQGAVARDQNIGLALDDQIDEHLIIEVTALWR